MHINEQCAKCLYDKQKSRIERMGDCTDGESYLAEVKKVIDQRKETDTAPYMIYVFDRIFRKYYDETKSYIELKKEYNQLVLSMEKELEEAIKQADNPLMTALLYARIGNYIDFGAMNQVDKQTFLDMFKNVSASESDQKTYQSFLDSCTCAKTFLLLADNCGEIVLDKLFLRQLKKRFPQLECLVMVRGEEVLNDAVLEDAVEAGISQEAEILSSGNGVPGMIYTMLPEKIKEIFDQADVILAKGQGNYEALSGQGRKIFYSFLCKCQLFTERFGVKPLTGMFIEENC